MTTGTNASSCHNATSDDEHHVFVRAKFSIPSHLALDEPPAIYNHSFNESNCSQIALGLPVGSIPCKPKAGDTAYSGMHDQGPLVLPKEGGVYAHLLGCVEAAKIESDKLMTHIIEMEKNNPREHSTEKMHRSEVNDVSISPSAIHESKKPRQNK